MPTYSPLPFDEEDYELGAQAEQLAQNANIHLVGDPQLYMLMADEQHTPVAAAWIDSNDDTFSFDIVVDDAAQGQGLGAQLVEACLDEWRDSQEWYPGAELRVHVVNPKMITLLFRQGMTVDTPLEYPQSAVMIKQDAPGKALLSQAFRDDPRAFEAAMQHSADIANIDINDWIATVTEWASALPSAITPPPSTEALQGLLNQLRINEFHRDFLCEMLSMQSDTPAYHQRYQMDERADNAPLATPNPVAPRADSPRHEHQTMRQRM
jgi:GNAT superfamily N-acetyltransferase